MKAASWIARRSPPLWVWIVALLPGTLNLLPVLEGYQEQEPPGRIFLGLRHYAVDETQYLGLAREVERTGSVVTRNPFVTEAHAPRFINLYPALVGLLARWTGAPLIGVWHVVGVLSNTLFFLVGWWALGVFLPDARRRRDAFVMLCLGSGLVWVLNGIRAWGVVDLKLDAEPLRYLLNWTAFNAARVAMPLLAYAVVVLVLGTLLRLARRGPLSGGRDRAMFAGVGGLAVLAFFIHPYTGLLALALLAAMGLVPLLGAVARRTPLAPVERWLGQGLLIALGVAVVAIGGFGLWARTDPVYAATAGQLLAWRVAYDPWWYPLTYGLPFVLAVLGAVHLQRDIAVDGVVRRWTLTWALTIVLLASCIFIPGVKFQPHLYLPLVILAAHGVEALRVRFAPTLAAATRRIAHWALYAILVAGTLADLTSAPPTWLFADQYREASQPRLELLQALQPLPEGGVLASQYTSALVPWKADHSVYYGHWFMSYAPEARRQAIMVLLDPATPRNNAAGFLRAQRIRYVVEDRWFRLPPELVQDLALRPLFANAEGRILEVPGASSP